RDLVERRAGRPYADVASLWSRSGLSPAALECLARADAFGSLGLDRRAALWAIRRLGDAPLPLFAAAEEARAHAPISPTVAKPAPSLPSLRGAKRRSNPGAADPASDAPVTVKSRRSTLRAGRRIGEAAPSAEFGAEPSVTLPPACLSESVMRDYAALRLSLKDHPMRFLRAGLAQEGHVPTARLRDARNGSRLRTAGLVLVRQRPGTASGVIFITLEDETGIANLVVWPGIFERYRRAVLTAGVLSVVGRVQREG